MKEKNEERVIKVLEKLVMKVVPSGVSGVLVPDSAMFFSCRKVST